MSSNGDFSTYPPDIACFAEGFWDPEIFQINNCSVTDNMVNFLNLSGSNINVKPFLTVYCLNPPSDDGCPFGFCPNPDIAGPLVRFSNYIAGFCLAVLIFYAPKRVKDAFWSQSLITYSLLLTCGVSLIQGSLTRYHAIILISIVCSPVNVYFTGYSIRAFWSSHRLDAVLGKKQHIRRAMVFFSVAVWIAILVYAYLPQRYTKFSQDTCRGGSIAEAVFLGAPFVFIWAMATNGFVGIATALLAPPIIVIVAWIFAIFWKRKEIWPPGERYRPRFGKVWRTIVTNYPFLQFLTVVAIPTAYWVAYVELGVYDQWDIAFSLTFGQVLTVFMTVPPIIEVAHLTPAFWRWLINLTWVRYITRRPAPQVPGPEELGTPDAEFIDEKKEFIDDQSSFMDELPLLGRQKTDHSDETTERDTLLDNRS